VIAVEMRNNHIGNVCKVIYDGPAHLFSGGNLNGMQKQVATLVTESDTRIYQDPAVRRLDQAGKTTNAERFSSKYLDFHYFHSPSSARTAPLVIRDEMLHFFKQQLLLFTFVHIYVRQTDNASSILVGSAFDMQK